MGTLVVVGKKEELLAVFLVLSSFLLLASSSIVFAVPCPNSPNDCPGVGFCESFEGETFICCDTGGEDGDGVCVEDEYGLECTGACVDPDCAPPPSPCGPNDEGIELYGYCWYQDFTNVGNLADDCDDVCDDIGYACVDDVNWDNVAENCDIHTALGVNCATCNGTQDTTSPANVGGTDCVYQAGADFSCGDNAAQNTFRICPCEAPPATTTTTTTTLPEEDSCNDSQGGVNYFEQGHVYGYLDAVPYGEPHDQVFYDYCLDENTLRERYCTGVSAAYEDYDCGDGYFCSSNVCTQIADTCDAANVNLDVYVQGYVSGYSGGDLVDDYDWCDNGMLRQWKCDDEFSRSMLDQYDCGDGYSCVNGACAEDIIPCDVGCPEGTACCADGNCWSDCTPYGYFGCVGGFLNFVCEGAESCDCQDCDNQQDKCGVDLTCDPDTNLCVADSISCDDGCPEGTVCCADGSCWSDDCNIHGGYLGCDAGGIAGICDETESCDCADCLGWQDKCVDGLFCSFDTALCVADSCDAANVNLDVYVRGYVSGYVSGQPSDDYDWCSGGLLRQWKCDDEFSRSMLDHDCGEGYSCLNGACVEDTISCGVGCPEGTTCCADGNCWSDCDGRGGDPACNSDDICDAGESCACADCDYAQDRCADGLVCDPDTNVCVVPDDDSCTDSQGGVNYVEQGHVYGYLDAVPYGEPHDQVFYDYCADENTLVERYCSGVSAAFENHACGDGYFCSSNVCTQIADTCDAANVNLDVNVQGYVSGYSGGQLVDDYDWCQEVEEDVYMLRQWQCDDATSRSMLDPYDCGEGYSCVDGGCVENIISCDVGCPEGTTCCADGNCWSDCDGRGGYPGCDDDGVALVCDLTESCDCSDCDNQQDKCVVGLICDSDTNLCVVPEEDSCTDSQDEINYFDQGHVYGYLDAVPYGEDHDQMFYDYCADENTLVERYCNGVSAAFENHACGDGYFCSSNVCTQIADCFSPGDQNQDGRMTDGELSWSNNQNFAGNMDVVPYACAADTFFEALHNNPNNRQYDNLDWYNRELCRYLGC